MLDENPHQTENYEIANVGFRTDYGYYADIEDKKTGKEYRVKISESAYRRILVDLSVDVDEIAKGEIINKKGW